MAASKHDRQSEHSLFYTLAHDLKTPLVRIAYMAEASHKHEQTVQDIQAVAQQTLQTLDAYVLSLTNQQTQLALEPVSPSAIVADAAYNLRQHAQDFMCHVHVIAPKKHTVILAHRHSMATALTMLGRAFIESQQNDTQKAITLAAYATKKGIAIGVFSKTSSDVSKQFMANARHFAGTATRPFKGMAQGTASQLFIADQLTHSAHSVLRTARRGSQQGLAFDMQLTSQLALV